MFVDNPKEEAKAPLEEGKTPPEEGKEPLPEPAKEEDPKEKRYIEQLKGSKAEAERLLAMVVETAVEKVEADNDYFLELFQKDPSIAEKVAKQFGVTAKEAIDKIKASKGEKPPIEKQQLDKEQLFKEWEALQEEKQAKKAAVKHFEWLEPAQKEAAQKTFELLIDGKSLSVKELSDVAEMAALYARKDSLISDAKDKAIAWLSSTPLSKWGSEVSKSNRKEVAGARDLAKALGLEHLYK